MEKRRFEGVIIAATGLHIAEPSDGTYRLNKQTKYIEKNKADSAGPQITRTVREHVINAARPGSEGGSNRPFSEFPIIAANSIRGTLRRLAAKIVFNSLKMRGQTISDYAYQGMMTGATYEGVDKELSTLERVLAAREHPFLGLWGGGPAMFESNCVTHAGSVLTPQTAKRMRVHESYHDYMMPDVDGFRFTAPVETIRHDDFIQPRKGSWENFDVVRDWKARRAKIEESYGINRAARKAQDAGAKDKDKIKKIDLSNMMAIEVVNPGTTFFFRMGLCDSLRDYHIGFAAAVVAEMFNDRIGGWNRNGFGEILPRIDYVANGKRLNALELDQDGIRFVVNEKVLKPEMDAFREKLAEITSESLDDLYRNQSVVTALRKAAKKAAAEEGEAAGDAPKTAKAKGAAKPKKTAKPKKAAKSKKTAKK